MLASVEAQIRNDIPRLMELTKGCKLWFADSYNSDLIKIIGENNEENTFYVIDEFYEVSEYKKDYVKEEYTIIGHEIIINDVLEWLAKYDFYCITSNGNLMKPVDGGKYYYEFEFTEIKVNLSSPYLKDQSEEMIIFLYNLKKD